MSDLTFIEQYIGKNIAVPKSKTKLEYIKSLTHLYLHNKFIQRIGNLAVCENLLVLYLHENEIKMIENLEPLLKLTHLYLQKNQIYLIADLDKNYNLKKLYLGCNRICVVEGLDKLWCLEELHVEKQRLPKGECLCFDPRTINNLSDTLQVLNISYNNISSLNHLLPLKRIKVLNASYNKLTDVKEVASVIQNWYYLLELNFIGNPMVKQHRYKDTIIANSFQLVILDTKDISETTRTFIKRFEQEKATVKSKTSKMDVEPKNIPGSVSPQLKKTVSTSLARNLSQTVLTSNLNEKTEMYIPWKALKTTVSDSGKTCPPLFHKQQSQQQQQQQQKKNSSTRRVQFSMFPQMQ